MADSEVTLKLLIDTKNHRVLFAEAGKNAVDFLFHILTLPMGTIIRLLSKQEMVGCLANLYDSVENLNETYIQKDQNKDILLKPRSLLGATFSSPLLALPEDKAVDITYYRCGYNYDCYNCGGYNSDAYDCGETVSDGPGAICPYCDRELSHKMMYIDPPVVKLPTVGDAGLEGGFGKGVVTYMVMDDLVVKPMSTISSIALLHKFNVREVRALEEKVVHLGINEALNLLKTSLASETVLTTVFLKSVSK